MLTRLEAILQFYGPYAPWSFAYNILALVFGFHWIPTVITKLLLLWFLWYLTHETSAKRKFVFYNNLGISTVSLFAVVFLIDGFITTVFLLIMKAFL